MDYKTIFEQLFKSQFKPLCMFSGKYLYDLDIAKDVVHNVFIELWEKKETIDFSKPLKSYLFTSVYNRSMNYIRDHKKFTRDLTTLNHTDEEDSSAVRDFKNEEELEEKLNKALNVLPEKCREIFMMSRFDELKYNEIAKKLDISVKTVETQMSKALKILREHLKELLIFIAVWFIYRFFG